MQLCFLFCHKTSRCDFPNNENGFDFVSARKNRNTCSSSTVRSLRQRLSARLHCSPIEFFADRMSNKDSPFERWLNTEDWRAPSARKCASTLVGLVELSRVLQCFFQLLYNSAVVFGTLPLSLSLSSPCMLAGWFEGRCLHTEKPNKTLQQTSKYRFGSLKRILLV